MSRDEGFAVADVATAKHTDPKFRRLWRLLGDESRMNAAAVLYEAVQLASWQQGDRVTVDEAAPFWVGDPSESVAALQEVGLLDGEGRIPAHAWESWYRPAYDRREQRRDAGRIGGQRSRGAPDTAEASPKQPSSGASASVNPSVPTVPSVPSDPPEPGGMRAIAIPVKGMDGTVSEVNPGPDIPPDAVKIQQLAEELTERPYILANLHGSLGQKVLDEQLRPHRWHRVEQAWRSVNARIRASQAGPPTLRQLIFGADDLLNPIPSGLSKEAAEDDEQRRYDRRVEATNRRLAEMRATE